MGSLTVAMADDRTAVPQFDFSAATAEQMVAFLRRMISLDRRRRMGRSPLPVDTNLASPRSLDPSELPSYFVLSSANQKKNQDVYETSNGSWE